MPPLQLVLLAIIAMATLATLRVVRVHFGRTPLPEGRGRRAFLLGFVVVPPLALGVLTQTPAATGPLHGVSSLPIYVVIVSVLALLMAIAAVIVGRVAPNRSGQRLRLALVGSEDDLSDLRYDPPVTEKLAAGVVVVASANAAFPRGVAFPAQIDRAGFRADWDALDGATRTLERQMADDDRCELGVASGVRTIASDARSRLDTLRRLAAEHGQTWAAA